MTHPNQEAADRIRSLLEQDKLLRGQWTRDLDERCLLAAVSEQVALSRCADSCPTTLMPQWLAHLTPWIDDEGSPHLWRSAVLRYADLMAHWHVLDDAAWNRAKIGAALVCLNKAREFVFETDDIRYVDAVISWLSSGATYPAAEIPESTVRRDASVTTAAACAYSAARNVREDWLYSPVIYDVAESVAQSAGTHAVRSAVDGDGLEVYAHACKRAADEIMEAIFHLIDHEIRLQETK